MGLTTWQKTLRAGSLSVYFCVIGSTLACAGNLLSSLDLAWSQDPVLQSAVQAHQINLTRIPQARAGLLPSINLTAQSSSSNGSYSFSGSEPNSRPIHNNSQALQLTQALYRPQLRHALAQAHLQAVQTLAQLQQAEQDLMLRLLQAYAELQTAKDHQKVVAAQLKHQSQQLLVAQRGLHFGTHAQPEVDEARSKYAMLQSQSVEAATQWRIKRQELVKITGESWQGGADQWEGLSDSFSVQTWADTANQKTLAQWMEQARTDAPAVRAQMAAVEVALRDIQKNRAGHLPTFDFTASRTHNNSSGNASSAQDFESASRVTQYGVQLTIPIYAGGSITAKSREAVATWDKAQFDLDAAQQQAEGGVQQAFDNAESAKAQILALQSAIEAAQAAIQGNLTGLRIGKRTLLQVYDSEQQLAAAQRDWRKARYDLMIQIAKIKASAGLLGREDFIVLNEGFNATSSPNSAAQDSSEIEFKSALEPQQRLEQRILSEDMASHSLQSASDHFVSQGAQNTAP